MINLITEKSCKQGPTVLMLSAVGITFQNWNAELHENLPITSEGSIFVRCPAPVSLQPQAWGLYFRCLDSPYLGRSCRNILQTLMNQGACGGSEGLEIHFCSPKSVNKTMDLGCSYFVGALYLTPLLCWYQQSMGNHL